MRKEILLNIEELEERIAPDSPQARDDTALDGKEAR